MGHQGSSDEPREPMVLALRLGTKSVSVQTAVYTAQGRREDGLSRVDKFDRGGTALATMLPVFSLSRPGG